MDDNSVPILAVTITLFASQLLPYALLQPKLMPQPPHRAGDRPDATRQLLSVMKVWQENFAANLSVVRQRLVGRVK